MGVINTQDCEKRVFMNYSSRVHQDDTLLIEDDIPTSTQEQRTGKNKAHCRIPKPQSYIRNKGRKARGCANSRRFENAIFLSDLIDAPTEFEDLVITDFVVNAQSAFKILFEDKSQMDKWSDFIAMDGDEQDTFLKQLPYISVDKTSVHQKSTKSKKSKLYNETDLQNAAKCFQKLDKKIKTTLKNRELSMDGLKFFEEEISSFFTFIDDGVLLFLIPSSMDRLLVHAISQYMNLISTSHRSQVIQVENRKKSFYPPTVLLSQYLQHVR